MLINDLIFNFRKFIIGSWPSIIDIQEHLDWDNTPYFLECLLQANWELLVEKQLPKPDQFLAPYGYNISVSNRYSEKDVKTTHQISCKRLGEIKSQFIFLCFVSSVENSYKFEPPFDFIDVQDKQTGERMSIPLEGITFFIEEI